MKLVVMVVQAQDAGALLKRLAAKGFRATRLATEGGFLRRENTTVFAGVQDDQVEAVFDIVDETCVTRREDFTPITPALGVAEFFLGPPVEVEVGGAAVFVLDVEQFRRM